jgi:PAP2 superfamily protein
VSAPATTRRPTLRAWREALYIAVFYGIYTLVRDLQGSAGGSGIAARATVTAFHHARGVIRVEHDLHIFREQSVQQVFIHAKLFLQFCDLYYGSAHFVVTAAALIWLFRRDPARYPRWRNTLALTTGLALIGFATYPLMPPRLLGMVPGTHYGFVDTLQRFGGSWSFDSDAMRKVSNQYAAMPSLHFAWALWCACVFYPACRRQWTRALAVAHPIATLFAVVVTANHYVLDAVAGAVVFAVAYLLAAPVTTWEQGRLIGGPGPPAADPVA